MSNRVTEIVHMGAALGSASDVTSYTVRKATDPVAATHEEWPTDAGLVANVNGARLHLVAFADTQQGTPPTATIPAIPPSDPIPPDIEAQVTQGGVSKNTGDSIPHGGPEVSINGNQFIVIDMEVPASPSGCVIEVGDATAGLFVGFVGGLLVLKAGDTDDGPDVRVTPPADMLDSTGTLFIELNHTEGTIQGWWLHEDSSQTDLLALGSGDPGQDWAAASNGELGGASGDVNIEGGSAAVPTVEEPIIYQTFAPLVTAKWGDHVEGDDLWIVASMHSYGQNGASDAQVSGPWLNDETRLLAYKGSHGKWAPTVFVFRKKASSDNEQVPLKFYGPTRYWHKTVATFVGKNVSQGSAELGSTLRDTDEAFFPAGAAGAGRVVRMVTVQNISDLNVPAGHDLLATNEPEHRAQLLASSTNIAEITDHPVEVGKYHTAITMSLIGDTVNEGSLDFNGTITQARFYPNQLAPGNIEDPGTFADPGTAEIPGDPAIPFTAGTIDADWANAEAGLVLEAVRLRIRQSRTGAGIWNGRLVAISPDGDIRYGDKPRPTYELPADGDIHERYFGAQTHIIDGTSWGDLIAQGWAPGVLLEAERETLEDFGEAFLDVASLELRWTTPPQATILSPVTGALIDTVTPEIGWGFLDGDIQSGYQVKVWTDYDPDNPDTNVVYDSGQIVSVSARDHQVTLPLQASSFYTIGLQIIGETVNGQPLVAGWKTSEIVTPEETQPATVFPNLAAAAQPDGSVEVTADASTTASPGDWFFIERAEQPAIDALADPSPNLLGIATASNYGDGWYSSGDFGQNVGPVTSFVFEWHGWLSSWGKRNPVNPNTSYSSNHETSLIRVPWAYSVQLDEHGAPSVNVWTSDQSPNDPPAYTYTIEQQSDLDRLHNDIVPRPQDGFGMRISLLPQALARFEFTTNDGEKWETAFETYAPDDGSWGAAWVEGWYEGVGILGHRPTVGSGFTSGEGFTRSLHTEIDGSTHIDIDVERDADEGDTTFTDGEGYVWTRRDDTSSVRLERRVGPAKQLLPRITAGYSLVSTMPVTLNAANKRILFEWQGTIAATPSTASSPLVVLYDATLDGGNTWFGLARSIVGDTPTFTVFIYVEGAGGFSQLYRQVPIPGVGESRCGIRGTIGETDAAGEELLWAISTTTDGGNSWQEVLREQFQYNGPTIGTIADMTTAGSMLVGADEPDQDATTERFYLAELTIGSEVVIADLDFGRDVSDNTDPTVTDAASNVWTLLGGAEIVDLPDWSGQPFDYDDAAFRPVVGLRAAPYDSAEPRWVDTNPPQGVPLIYRMRGITEPARNFQTASTEAARTAAVTVDPVAWRLGNLDGTIRFDLHPAAVSTVHTGRGKVATGLGDPYHVVSAEPLKARYQTVTVETRSEAEYDTLRSLIDGDHTLTCADVHGNAFYVRRVGDIVPEQILAEPAAGEPWKVRHVYRTTFDLAEERPPDLGYGQQ